ncbi:MAG: carboxypeptidase-like regulatory domain-containing protein, partial [Chitinophagaceae bacterium]
MRLNPLKLKATFYGLLCLLFIFCTSDLHAQERPGLVKGIVTNDDGDPLPGVSVTIKNTRTNFTAGTTTDSSGTFTFSPVTTGGPYSFTFSTVGYES